MMVFINYWIQKCTMKHWNSEKIDYCVMLKEYCRCFFVVTNHRWQKAGRINATNTKLLKWNRAWVSSNLVSSSRWEHLNPILILFFCPLPCQGRRFSKTFPAALIPLPNIWSAVHSVVGCINDNRRHVQIVTMYCYKFSSNFVVLKSRYFLEHFVSERCNLCSSSKSEPSLNAQSYAKRLKQL